MARMSEPPVGPGDALPREPATQAERRAAFTNSVTVRRENIAGDLQAHYEPEDLDGA
jgi:hypothetical protein